jgi:sodium/bile acid cotransporter 7
MIKHSEHSRIRRGTTTIALAFCSIFLFLPLGCREEGNSVTNIERVNTLYQESKAQFPETPDISAEELMKRKEAEIIILVDNRKEEEMAISMIPGAISVQEFEDNIDGYASETVVVYCTIGDRSGHYTKRLRKQNIDARNLKGGVLSWAHAGGVFLDNQGERIPLVHVYGSKWNLLPDGYEAIW